VLSRAATTLSLLRGFLILKAPVPLRLQAYGEDSNRGSRSRVFGDPWRLFPNSVPRVATDVIFSINTGHATLLLECMRLSIPALLPLFDEALGPV